ncbi:hypothetical protein GALL_319890 [mine drainage metagenome]|uniref:Uncharacterized protein n=1 Tax=mine drainage metagenome TaxID=410659 RepID=A0A1J5RDC7_9ZZZZ
MNGPGARSSCETSLSTQTGHVRGLAPVEVPGHTRRGENGGANDPEEADAVVAWVLAHLDEPGTLEVVTPFAAQAALITARLTAALGASALPQTPSPSSRSSSRATSSTSPWTPPPARSTSRSTASTTPTPAAADVDEVVDATAIGSQGRHAG